MVKAMHGFQYFPSQLTIKSDFDFEGLEKSVEMYIRRGGGVQI